MDRFGTHHLAVVNRSGKAYLSEGMGGFVRSIICIIRSGSDRTEVPLHLLKGSLPILIMPVCCLRSESTLASDNLESDFNKPSLRRTFVISSPFPVRKIQPGLTPYLFAYSLSTA